MNITFTQIIAATSGIVRTEQNDRGLELHRFTREQEAFFYKTHDLYCHESYFNGYFGRNCRSCAGVVIDFTADGKELSLSLGAMENQSESCPPVLDLFVDGERAASFTLTSAETPVTYTADGARHRYTLYLPYFAFPTIASLTLSGATEFVPHKREAEILFLGDSITHGVRAAHPADTYVMRTARALEVGILNQGNSGFVYDAGSVARVCDPKIVVTAYGINDFMRKDLTRLARDTREFLIRVRQAYPAATLVSVLPLWTAWDGENDHFKQEERDCLTKIYAELSDHTVDGHALIPHDKKYLDDDVHPKSEGFAVYAERLSAVLADLLKR